MNIFRKILGGERDKNRGEASCRPWQLRCSYASLQGIGMREQQQDAFRAINVKDAEGARAHGMLALVADGMGGMAGGAEASELVCLCMDECFRAMDMGGDIPAQLNSAVSAAGEEVYKALQGSGGSTVVACVIYKDKLFFTSVGDSGLYLYRGSQLSRLNREQNLKNLAYQQLIREGGADPNAAYTGMNEQALTHFVGMETLDDVDYLRRPFTLMAGDVLLICSDGVDGSMPESELVRCLSGSSAKDICLNINDAIDAAELPYQDNYTALVLKFGE